VAALAGYFFVFSCLSLVLGHALANDVLVCFFCSVWEGVSFGMSSILSSSRLCHPSGGGASLSSGWLDAIFGVGSVVSRRVLGLSDLGLS
jgi:hypothetical protein